MIVSFRLTAGNLCFYNTLVMRFKLKRTCKCLALLVTCTVVYLFANCGLNGCSGRSEYELEPIHVADTHPKLGQMLNVEDFWTPEKDKIIPNGPGSNGAPVETESENQEAKDRAYSEYGFNQFISDKISLERSIKDTRHSA